MKGPAPLHKFALLLLALPTGLTRSAPPLQEKSPAKLRQMAAEYYEWRDRAYPVASSDAGLHTWDSDLTDYSEGAVRGRRARVAELLAQVRSFQTKDWAKDDRVDAILFQAQLEGVAFGDRVLNFEETNPLTYVGECTNAVFSLIKKDFGPARDRALAVTARFEKMPALIDQANRNLKRPVRLYAQLTIEAARSVDSLFKDSLAGLARALSGAELARFEKARDGAIASLHAFADRLERKLPEMVPFSPMGEENYNYYLRHVYLLPLDASQVAMLGEAELARYRGLESLLPDPALADPDPARSKSIPKDQAAFLAAYESREDEMIRFLRDNRLVTLPDSLGPFRIRQLPEAFKPTHPGGFMNPPGLHDSDPSGMYFIPTYNPKSDNFYIRAAIEDPRPILGHEGIPGHFLQISIAHRLANDIRRHHDDGVFIEGWALYGEEMLLHTGLYPQNSPAHGQILRLSRYRAARIGVDVNLHTGRWSFEEAVKYFMDAGGLDREAAEGEAAGAAADPTQKITYMVGKWQIMRLLGRYRGRHPTDFRLGAFHDDLLKNGSLPLSIVEWLLLDDPGVSPFPE